MQKRFFLYATGGGAYANIEIDDIFRDSGNQHLWGYFFGAGVDIAVNDTVFVGFELRHTEVQASDNMPYLLAERRPTATAFQTMQIRVGVRF